MLLQLNATCASLAGLPIRVELAPCRHAPSNIVLNASVRIVASVPTGTLPAQMALAAYLFVLTPSVPTVRHQTLVLDVPLAMSTTPTLKNASTTVELPL